MALDSEGNWERQNDRRRGSTRAESMRMRVTVRLSLGSRWITPTSLGWLLERIQIISIGSSMTRSQECRQTLHRRCLPSGRRPARMFQPRRAGRMLSLLVDRRTGSIPAVITFPHNVSTPLQTHGWLNFWMRANAKTLFAEAVSVPRLPVATVVDSNKGVEHLFWDSEVRFDRNGLRTVGGAWGKWDELCEREETYRRLGFWSKRVTDLSNGPSANYQASPCAVVAGFLQQANVDTTTRSSTVMNQW